MMSLFKHIFLGGLLVLGINTYAQKTIKKTDLKSVDVIGNYSKYMIANKTVMLDSMELSSVSAGTLTDMLNKYLPIYVKQNAGGLATIHFRGTSADHTAIMYNGININSLTLGHSNVSNIPAFLFNDVKVQFGSASALYGTDAIGGSIHLANKTIWNKGFQISLHQNIASFHNYFSGLKLGYSNKAFSYSIKGYYTKKKNDFTFTNYSAKDFTTNEFRQDTSRNSAVLNYGILQDINFIINNKLKAYMSIWYEDDWHEIQPNMSANYYGGGDNQIHNKHLRSTIGIKYFNKNHKITSDYGYIWDHQVYNKNESAIIATKSNIIRFNYSNSKLWKGDFIIGINFKHIKPDVYAYSESLKEDRFDIYSSYKRIFLKKLAFSVNLRQSFVTDYKARFSPSVGLNYTLFKNTNNTIIAKTSYSNSYKIPTFNHRYWLPNGNPDLLPESSNTYELGGDYSFSNKNTSITIGTTLFYMKIGNWIQWINVAGWRPMNIKEVESKGIEFTANGKQKIGKLLVGMGGSYTYNSVKEKDSYNGQKTFNNKQMIYSPVNMANARLSFSFKKFIWFNSLAFTGERVTESSKILDSYSLLDTKLSRTFTHKKHNFNISIAINNILNTEYQNWEYYAMPGINYNLNLIYYIN